MDDDRIDKIIDGHRGKPNALIQVLLEIQHENRWLPRQVLEKVSRSLDVPLSKVIQTATFYKTFSLIPKGRHEVQVCRGSSCHVRGSARVLDAVQDRTGIRPGETDAGERFSLETCNCLGYCNSGPGIFVDGEHHGPMTPESVEEVLEDYE
jgi:NADH-quinone oxidoreductase subunit E